MKIKDLYQAGKPVISFEIFPPKKDTPIESIYETLAKLSGLRPGFISVTYGAGGGSVSSRTGQIAAAIKREHGVESLAHLTCISATRERIQSLAAELREAGVENILAMRGDLPAAGGVPSSDYRYAVDLIRELRELGGFCIGGACYPEGHIDCADPAESIHHMKLKQEAGVEFFISQLFFDNTLFHRFREEAVKAGITAPISGGIMPLLSRSQIERMIFLCGASLPSAIIKLLHRYEDDPEALRAAGLEYAVAQMEDLARNGADGVHIYTMNRPSIATRAIQHLRELGYAD